MIRKKQSLQVWKLVNKMKNESSIYLAIPIWTVTSDSQWVEIPATIFNPMHSKQINSLLCAARWIYTFHLWRFFQKYRHSQIKKNTGGKNAKSAEYRKLYKNFMKILSSTNKLEKNVRDGEPID